MDVSKPIIKRGLGSALLLSALRFKCAGTTCRQNIGQSVFYHLQNHFYGIEHVNVCLHLPATTSSRSSCSARKKCNIRLLIIVRRFCCAGQEAPLTAAIRQVEVRGRWRNPLVSSHKDSRLLIEARLFPTARLTFSCYGSASKAMSSL